MFVIWFFLGGIQVLEERKKGMKRRCKLRTLSDIYDGFFVSLFISVFVHDAVAFDVH